MLILWWFYSDLIVIYGDLMVILWELWIVNGYLLRMAWRLSQSLSNVANPSKNLEHLEGLLLHPFLANGDAWNWVCRYRPIEKLQNFMAARPKAILEGQGTWQWELPMKNGGFFHGKIIEDPLVWLPEGILELELMGRMGIQCLCKERRIWVKVLVMQC